MHDKKRKSEPEWWDFLRLCYQQLPLGRVWDKYTVQCTHLCHAMWLEQKGIQVHHPSSYKNVHLTFFLYDFFFSLCWQKNSCVWRLLLIMMLFISVLSIAFFQEDKMEICMCFQGCYSGIYIHFMSFLSYMISSCLYQRLRVCVFVCVTWQKKRRIYFLYSQGI